MTAPMRAVPPGPQANVRRATAIVAAGALPPAVVLGAIALAGGAVVAVVVFVVAAVALAAWIWLRADGRAVAAIDGKPPDPASVPEHARLVNLVEGLCAAAGVPQPRLRVFADPALNAVAVGSNPKRATLAVTTGLLEHLGRVELEAVVATALVRIKRRDTLPGTVAASAGPLGRLLAGQDGSEAVDDLEAVSLTRYPPGLAAALEAMASAGTGVAGAASAVAGLWLADPRPGAPGAGRLPLAERIQALREL